MGAAALRRVVKRDAVDVLQNHGEVQLEAPVLKLDHHNVDVDHHHPQHLEHILVVKVEFLAEEQFVVEAVVLVIEMELQNSEQERASEVADHIEVAEVVLELNLGVALVAKVEVLAVLQKQVLENVGTLQPVLVPVEPKLQFQELVVQPGHYVVLLLVGKDVFHFLGFNFKIYGEALQLEKTVVLDVHVVAQLLEADFLVAGHRQNESPFRRLGAVLQNLLEEEVILDLVLLVNVYELLSLQQEEDLELVAVVYQDGTQAELARYRETHFLYEFDFGQLVVVAIYLEADEELVEFGYSHYDQGAGLPLYFAELDAVL